MQRNLRLNLVAFVLWLLLASQTGAQQKTLLTQQQPILWPESNRPALSVSETNIMFDGYPVSVLRLQIHDLAIEISNRPDFTIESSSSNRFSGTIKDSSMPGVTIGISLFNKTEFLPDLSEKTWKAYLEGIVANNPSASIVFENSNIEERITPYVFDQQFRQVAYEVAEGSNIEKTREIFAFIGDSLLVFSASGSKEAIDQNWFKVEQLISEMQRAS